MSNINDLKHAGLLTESGLSSGNVRDLEVVVMQANTSLTTNNINDLWQAFFDLQGVAAGQLDDRAYAWLGSLGHTGSLSERWLAFWTSPTFVSGDFLVTEAGIRIVTDTGASIEVV